ncbi:MAG: polysaccharide deacetylase family protein [Magnetococcales bacterium]|nr:polysaccharide deacetylase family protein [Magnetococcales bacterium]MBF0116054.1 polysaccharide deacetylase family protein [Magnetococcales bacterium]
MSYRWVGLLLYCVVLVAGIAFPALADAESDPATLYLTFDDGPRNSTPEILQLLQREGLPATFFLIGSHVQISPSRLKTLQALQESPLVQIANHSFSHANEQYRAFYSHPEGVLADFQKNNRTIGLNTPPYPSRLPGRIDWRFAETYVNDSSHPFPNKRGVPREVELLFGQQFVLYGWDVEWRRNRRSKQMDAPELVAKEIKQRLQSGHTVQRNKAVLLMHDQNFSGPEGIERLQTLVRLLRQEGYRFDWMKNYLSTF